MQINISKDQKEIKSHGNFEFPVSVSLESIDSYEQNSFMWHWHPEIELTWVISGEIEYRINEKTYILREGDGLFGNSNTLHSGNKINDSNCYYVSVTFHPRFLYGYEGSLLQTKYVEFITSNEEWSSLKLDRELGWSKELIQYIKKIYEINSEKVIDYELEIHILLMKIWKILYSYFAMLPEKNVQSKKNIQRLRDIISYVQQHYDQELELEDIASHVNICKSECCRFFKKYMNMTIFEYLLYYRVQKSLILLRAGESVTKTAGIVGFSSPAYFGQIFKRYMNCTPKEYKNQIKKENL